jgi:hypothetical protein
VHLKFLNTETSLANRSIYGPFINTLLQQGGRQRPCPGNRF